MTGASAAWAALCSRRARGARLAGSLPSCSALGGAAGWCLPGERPPAAPEDALRGGTRTSNSSLNARVLCGLQALLASIGRDESSAELVGADPGSVVDSAMPVMEPAAGASSAGGLLAGLRELVDSMSRPDPGDLLDLLRAFVAKAGGFHNL